MRIQSIQSSIQRVLGRRQVVTSVKSCPSVFTVDSSYTGSSNISIRKKQSTQQPFYPVAYQTRSFASSLAQTVRKENERREDQLRRPKPLVDVQKQLWEFYLSTGRGANALFEAIDIRESGTIEPSELMSFMMAVLIAADGEQIDPKELMPYAWNRLEQREAAKQTYDMRSFKKWLVAATKMSADMKNSRMMEYMAQNPNTGEQYFSDVDDETMDVFTWNEETMSQSLRRMQYAGMLHQAEVLFTVTKCPTTITETIGPAANSAAANGSLAVSASSGVR